MKVLVTKKQVLDDYICNWVVLHIRKKEAEKRNTFEGNRDFDIVGALLSI